jgi:hypothetical protein
MAPKKQKLWSQKTQAEHHSDTLAILTWGRIGARNDLSPIELIAEAIYEAYTSGLRMGQLKRQFADRRELLKQAGVSEPAFVKFVHNERSKRRK